MGKGGKEEVWPAVNEEVGGRGEEGGEVSERFNKDKKRINNIKHSK